jgi:hypothetical protein
MTSSAARLATDLVWGGLALLGAMFGFSAGELSALGPAPGASESQAPIAGERRASARRVGDAHEGQSSAPRLATSASPKVNLAQPASGEEPASGQEPAARGLAPAPVQAELRSFLASARPQPKLALRLDPQAEELVQTLLSTRDLDGSLDSFYLVLLLQERAPLPKRRALLMALVAYFPDQDSWPTDLLTTHQYVMARHACYSQEPENQERLYLLQSALERAEPGAVDPAWLEALSQAHAQDGTFDGELARLAPRRAAAVFAAREGGLTRWQRRQLARGVATRSSRRGAALALEHLAETWDYGLLALAQRHDPAAAAAFARRHQADPRLLSAQTIVALDASFDRCVESESLEDWYQHLALAQRTWRRVLPQDRDEVLDRIAWEGAWTPLQEEIAQDLLRSGDPGLAGRAFSYSPVGSRLSALAGGRLPLGGVERDLLHEDFADRPFATHDQLHLFLSLVPRLDFEDALAYAAVLQRQGAPAASRQVLDRVSAQHSALADAKIALAAGESLEHFSWSLDSSQDD